MRPLVADGGELTVLRSLAAYSYGQWSVEWPDSVPEEQRPALPDEREFGYVAKLDKEPGRMGRRFVRADVSITAAEYTPEGKVIPYSGFSDVEQVIDEAASRTTGDVFFEREIERAGLNGSVPYVDFDVDDLVPVTLWGKSTIVPVTSIQEVTEAGEAVGWRVRVGGDLIADDVARERANRDIEAAIAQERRERLKDVGEVSAAASRAQSTANTARSEVQAVRDTLAGEQAQEPDLLTQLVAVNDELQRLGQAPQPSLMLAFVSLSTALWEAQRVLDAAQDDFAAQTREQADAQGELLDAVQAQVGEAAQSIWSLGTAGDGFWAVSGDTVTATGTWVGEAILDVTRQHTQQVVDRVTSSGSGSTTNITLERRSVTKVQVGTTRSWTFPSNVSALLAHYRQAAGVVRKWAQAIAQQVVGVSWTRLAEFTATREAPHSVDFTVGWDAAHRGATYSVRVVVDGVVRKTLSTTKLGPVFPSGNGYRTQRVLVTLDLVPGQVVEFQAMCDYDGESQRTVRDGSARVWWVES